MREFETTVPGVGGGLRPKIQLPGYVELVNLEPKPEGLRAYIPLLTLEDVPAGSGTFTPTLITRTVVLNVADYVSSTELEGVSVYVDGELQGATNAEGTITLTDIVIGGHDLKLVKAGYTDSDLDNIVNDYILVA